MQLKHPDSAQASDYGLDSITIDDLGECTKATIGRKSSLFVGGKGNNEEVEKRVNSLREAIESDSLSESERELLRFRLCRLAGGVAVLRVGGATESELRERKDRVDDALSATQAAIEEGVVPGGGVALVRSSQSIELKAGAIDGFSAGAEIIRRACEYPLKQIVTNSGGSADLVLEKIKSSDIKSYGYDAFNDSFGDMFEMGIIDPVKVVRCALENAASAGSMMLTVGCAMIEHSE